MTVPAVEVNASPLLPVAPMLSLADAVEWCSDVLTSVLDLSESSPVPAHASVIVWGLMSGQLRGRVPLLIPQDLLMVSASASIRWTNYLLRFRMTPMDPATGAIGSVTDTFFQGFTVSELVVLWRYRVRTA